VVFAPKVNLDIHGAEALTAAVHSLTDRPRPVFADSRKMRSADILSMRYAAGPETASLGTRLAILVGSPVSRMIGSVFLGLAKPPYPTRLFTSEDAAVAWLRAASAEDATDDHDRARNRNKRDTEADRARRSDGSAA